MKIKSKIALDKIIKKSRVHLYKPIQIAEILHHFRKGADIDLLELESYRNISKKWRDEVSQVLIGRISTSSQKFQDNLFERNAMPPDLLKELALYNNKNKGIVENYIYHRLFERLSMVFGASNFLQKATPKTFDLDTFLDMFTKKSGLKRSIDKVYEITVYALFSTIVRALEVEVTLSIGKADNEILEDFEQFIKLVLSLSKTNKKISLPAKLFRVGVTNAADRGIDMWTNFGPAVQVKHISLSEDLAEDVTSNITADKIVIVCKDGDASIIKKITNQLSFSDRIQGIITFSDLANWYKVCLSSKYEKTLGKQFLKDLVREFEFEFPSVSEIKPFLEKRDYNFNDLKGDWAVDL